MNRLLQNATLSVFLFVLVVGFSSTPGWAQANRTDDVISELRAFKVVKDAKGTESFEDTASVKPGDLIEYRLVYTNKRNTAISNLKPLLPVPAGTTYVDNSATPKLTAVSLTNGGELMPFPPVRKVKNAQGKMVNEQVPASEFKSLQWTVNKLNAGTSVTLKARISVNSN